MRVILIAHTQLWNPIPDYKWADESYQNHPTDADGLAEMSGRLDYLSWDRPNPATATNKGYLANIIKQGHFSVLEHASATFYIDGVSRNFTHELIRHRHLSFSEVSQRYVDVSEFRTVYPPAVLELIESGKRTIVDDWEPNHPIEGTAAGDNYETVVQILMEEGASRKEARQAARYWLPSGIETKILVTGNMRAWREVLQKRLALHPETGKPLADLEFYQVAQKILTNLREIAPNTFQDFE